MKDPAQIKWYYLHTRKRSPWYIYLLFQGFAVETLPMDGFKYWIRHCGAIDHQIVISQEDWDTLHDRLWDKLKQEPDFLLKQLQRSYKEHDILLKFAKDIYKTKDFTKNANKDLADLVDKYYKQLFRCGAFVLLPLYVEDDISKEISQQVEEKEYDVIMSPVKNGRELEERISLLKLAVNYNEEDLEEHWLNFAWLNDAGYYGDYFSKDYYQERAKKQENPAEELKEILAERKEHEETFNKILNKYKDNKRLHSLIEVINESIFYRSYRSEEYYRSGIYMTAFFEEIAKRLELNNFKEVFFLTPPEVAELLSGDKAADKKLIKQREQSFIALSDWDSYVIYQGDESKKITSQIDLQSSEQKDLKGQSAFGGLVKGRAVIVQGSQDFDKVQDGDILIAQSTQPNYVPILKKVKAIVTEEGGVLCHASVISRELKVPCVIGTKVATKVLKDGDKIEVDADKGIVKKL